VLIFGSRVAALILRAPYTVLNPQLVAEDGSVYFLDQLGRFLPLLFAPHQGYFVVAPRVLAAVASIFPVAWAPFFFSVGAIVASAACVAYFCQHARTLFHPLASLAVIALLPTLGGELFGVTANIQWFGQLVVVAAALIPRPAAAPSSSPVAILQVIVIAAMALTGPYAIFCAHLLFGLLLIQNFAFLTRFRSLADALPRYFESLDWVCLTVVVVAGLAHMIMALNSPALPTHFPSPSLSEFFASVAADGIQVHMFGLIPMGHIGFLCAEAGLIGVLLLAPAGSNERLSCVVLLAYGLLCLLAGYVKMMTYGMSTASFEYIDRYFFALVIFQWLVVWRIVDHLVARKTAVGICLLVGVMAGLAYRSPHLFPVAPPDMHWSAYAPRIAAGEAVDVPINPIPWQIHVPAREERK